MATKAIEVISMAFDAYQNCVKNNNQEWQQRHCETIKQICSKVMPHGSGLDGTEIELDMDASKPNKFVFVNLDFHHMDENGMYDGWSNHTAIVTPTFAGFNVKITGTNRNDTKDYLAEMIDAALNTKLEYSKALECYVNIDHAVYALGQGLTVNQQA